MRRDVNFLKDVFSRNDVVHPTRTFLRDESHVNVDSRSKRSMNGPSSKSSVPKIHFELASACILKNQSSNFRGSTVFRDMSREIKALVVSPTSRHPLYILEVLSYPIWV